MNEKWISLVQEQQISEFMSAANDLHKDLVQKLDDDHVPYFFNYWLKLFNHSDAWILSADDGPLALVTKPKVIDLHYQRWQYNTMVVSPKFSGPLELPFSSEKPIAFITPATDYAPFFEGRYNASYFQKTYGRTTHDLPEADVPEGVMVKRVETVDVDAVAGLLDQGYEWDGQPDGYVDLVKYEIEQAAKFKSGWCFAATRGGKPIAVASYLAIDAPLMGVTAATVADLVVAPEERRRGIGSALQRVAYHHLRDAGIPWIIGNIDPENRASIRQAESVGRSLLLHTLILHPQ